jgi:hypothetical protein
MWHAHYLQLGQLESALLAGGKDLQDSPKQRYSLAIASNYLWSNVSNSHSASATIMPYEAVGIQCVGIMAVLLAHQVRFW